MAEFAAIDFANQAFYEAFAATDLSAMIQVWAESVTVSCSHPGTGPIFGRGPVLESWRGIFSGMSSFPIRYRLIRVESIGAVGIAHTVEMLEAGVLVATNLFIKEGKVWRMIHHHAGPANVDPELMAERPREPVN